MNSVIEKLSHVLEDHQTKLKSLAVRAPDYHKNLNKSDASNLDPLGIHPRDYLVDLLTEWSQQFLETCRELQTSSHPHERCKGIIAWDDCLDNASTRDDTSVTNTETNLEELRMRYNSLVLTLENQLEETKQEVVSLQKNLDFSAQEAEGQAEVEGNLHQQQLRSMGSIKALVRGRPQKFIENANINKNQVAEVNKIENNKVCGQCGHSRDRNDVKSARNQQEGESNADKIERLQQINELTQQLHEQQSRNIKFAAINDGLVELNKTQAVQEKKMKEKVRLLQQKLIDKSNEANKFSKALRKATKAMSLNRTQCEVLRSKLDKCRKDLSRYCVEDMTSWKSET